MRKTFLFIALFIACIVYLKAESKYPHAIISNYISNHTATSFEEDSTGHIWIGTNRGLNRYNSYEYFQFFKTTDSTTIPDNRINSIYKDRNGRIWVCTVAGACYYTDKVAFKRTPVETSVKNLNVLEVIETKCGKILANVNHTIQEYNPSTESFKAVIIIGPNTLNTKVYISPDNNIWVLTPTEIKCYDINYKQILNIKLSFILTSSYMNNTSGEIFISSWGNKYLFDTRNKEFVDIPNSIKRHPILSKAIITQIVPFTTNSLIIKSLKHGLFLFNLITEEIISQKDNNFPFSVPETEINTLFVDSQKNLWIGTSDKGAIVKYSYKEKFNYKSFLNEQINNRSILSLSKDKNGNIWYAASNNKIGKYNITKNIAKEYDASQIFKDNNSLIWGNKLDDVLADSKGYLWVKSPYKIVKCSYNNNNLNIIKDYYFSTPITTIEEDLLGNIWLGGANNELYILKNNSSKIDTLKYFSKGFTFSTSLKSINTGEIVATAFERDILIINPIDKSYKILPIKGALDHNSFIPTTVFYDSQGIYWIGTTNSGLYSYNENDSKITFIEGISCEYICSIEEDAQGNLWVSTYNGLNKIERNNKRAIHYFNYDGIGGNQFNEQSSTLVDNTLYFGGTHGLTYFNPIDVAVKRDVPFNFEYIKVNNSAVLPSEDSTLINKSILHKPIIRLPHNYNSISIYFAALDYSECGKIHYAYKVDGINNSWIDLRNNREIHLSNLKPGKYKVHVKISNNDNTIIEKEDSISIIVTPAFWQTYLAKIIVLIFSIALILLIYRIVLKIQKDKESVKNAQKQREKEAELNRMNMSYFSNISHEFRTPLTIISGPIKQLCNSTNIHNQEKEMLVIVKRSVDRMLKLVNQIMDFNKLENDTLKLEVCKTDIIARFRNAIETFKLSAKSKNIAINLYGLEDSYYAWIDWDKIDKIIGNLLSNSLKFTPNGGTINVKFDIVNPNNLIKQFPLIKTDIKDITEEIEYIKISVSDTGNGIPSDKLEQIFEKFYQIENNKEKYNFGTGIGLYYSKRLVELHHGYIIAENREEDLTDFSNSSTGSYSSGAIFTFVIPSTENCYKDSEKISVTETDNENITIEENNTLINENAPMQAKETIESKKSLLIVDDDTDIVKYLTILLSPYYNVIYKFNAVEALKAIKESAPDIVLSDVIMPGKDGFELCKDIKEDLQICHIPVILITAKSRIEEQIEGLNTGADAYITKPFDPTYLIALIKSLINNREKSKQLLINSTKINTIEEKSSKENDIMLSPQDKFFMKELYSLMEKELSNPELNISKITEVLKISRTKFYYKIKGLTGENPNTFFKTYKLNRATELIREGRYNISEIADMVGFSSLPHFSLSFKKQFGISPSEYK